MFGKTLMFSENPLSIRQYSVLSYALTGAHISGYQFCPSKEWRFSRNLCSFGGTFRTQSSIYDDAFFAE